MAIALESVVERDSSMDAICGIGEWIEGSENRYEEGVGGGELRARISGWRDLSNQQ
jgi:hypothetical protein